MTKSFPLWAVCEDVLVVACVSSSVHRVKLTLTLGRPMSHRRSCKTAVVYAIRASFATAFNDEQLPFNNVDTRVGVSRRHVRPLTEPRTQWFTRSYKNACLQPQLMVTHPSLNTVPVMSHRRSYKTAVLHDRLFTLIVRNSTTANSKQAASQTMSHTTRSYMTACCQCH